MAADDRQLGEVQREVVDEDRTAGRVRHELRRVAHLHHHRDVEREELPIAIEKPRRGVIIPIAKGDRILRIASWKVHPFERLKWRIDR